MIKHLQEGYILVGSRIDDVEKTNVIALTMVVRVSFSKSLEQTAVTQL